MKRFRKTKPHTGYGREGFASPRLRYMSIMHIPNAKGLPFLRNNDPLHERSFGLVLEIQEEGDRGRMAGRLKELIKEKARGPGCEVKSLRLKLCGSRPSVYTGPSDNSAKRNYSWDKWIYVKDVTVGVP